MLTCRTEERRSRSHDGQGFVGKPIGPLRTLGRDAGERVPMIRQWCDAMSDDQPHLLGRRRLRRRRVHGGIVAPPTMLDAWTMQGWEMHKSATTSPRTSSSASTRS